MIFFLYNYILIYFKINFKFYFTKILLQKLIDIFWYLKSKCVFGLPFLEPEMTHECFGIDLVLFKLQQ